MPRGIASLTLALAVIGCSAGRDFVRPDSHTEVIGKTTLRDVVAKYGEPRRQGTALKNGISVKSVSYTYATAMPYVDDVPVKGAGFHFVDDVLVGFDFTSSFKDDMTKFDHSKVPLVRDGQTTRADVLALLGRPGGTYTYPLVKGKEDLGLVYSFVDATRTPFVPGIRTLRRTLVISVNPAGVVSDVSYTESEGK